MSEIQQTLAERGATYGGFKGVATLSQSLQATMHDSRNWYSMPDEMREALQTISSKIARILNGDPNHVDSWHAIAGNQYIGLGDGSQAGLYERMPSDIWVRADD